MDRYCDWRSPGDAQPHQERWGSLYCQLLAQVASEAHHRCVKHLSDSKYQIALQPPRPIYYYLTPSGRLQKSHYDEFQRLLNRLRSLLVRRHRLSVAHHWPDLYSAVCRILYRNDPCFVCIPFSVAEALGMPSRFDQRGEYEGEAASVIGSLPFVGGPDGVERILLEVLSASFGGTELIARKQRLQRIGWQIWSVWRSRSWPGLG
jgi:hypothetical protein